MLLVYGIHQSDKIILMFMVKDLHCIASLTHSYELIYLSCLILWRFTNF